MLKFFDSNFCVGRRRVPNAGAPNELSEFVEIMDRCGIEKAIVNHVAAMESDLMTGNLLLEDEVGNNPRFEKRWIIAPEFLDIYPSAKKFEEYFKKYNIKTVRVVPASFKHSMDPNVFGELAEMLTAHNIPLFIDRYECSWEGFDAMFKNFPELKIIITQTGYRDPIRYWYFLKNYANAYIETSNFVTHNGLAHFVNEFGSDRIIFGTDMPVSSAAAGVSLVRYADLADEDKERIAHGNIERILSEVTL